MTGPRLARPVGRTVAALVAVSALLGAGSAQATTVTVGSPLTGSVTGSFGGTATEANFALGEPGARVTSPVNGMIVSYRAKLGDVGRVAIRVLRPAGGSAFTGAGSSTTVTPPGTGLQTFSANLPIQAGDLVGLDLVDFSSNIQEDGVSGSTIYEWGNNGFLADGETASPANIYPDHELAFNAEIAPTNTVEVGATQRNKKKGTATLNLTLPNPGDLTASGSGVSVASAGGAAISKSVTAGAAQLLIKATGKKKKKLNQKGKVRVNVAITYTPTGGDPNTQSVKVKLKKKLKR
jgi:hypothetical protein